MMMESGNLKLIVANEGSTGHDNDGQQRYPDIMFN